MSTNLQEFLVEKRQALLDRRAQAGNIGPPFLRASTRAEGRSGIRRIRIRDFQLISDSGPDFAGYDLGELQPGVLSSCLTYVFLIHAAQRQVPLVHVGGKSPVVYSTLGNVFLRGPVLATWSIRSQKSSTRKFLLHEGAKKSAGKQGEK